MTRRLVLFSCLLAFLIPACQDYNYEEVQGSVHKVVVYSEKVSVSAAADILFVIDNSGSMAGEQRQLAESFGVFVDVIEEEFGDNYHIAIISTGMESAGCPRCDDIIGGSCTNITGESGRFQDLVCRNVGTDTDPTYECDDPDPGCRVVTSDNLDCFYNPATNAGTVFAGVDGCGYERGLAPLKNALGPLTKNYNAGFLRHDATLAVIVISDEEDCGEIGEVYENSTSGGNVCNFAVKGVGPEGETAHPEDPQQREYRLSRVSEYRDFLVNEVKGGREEMVRFAAIVGMKDAKDPTTTTIEYELDSRGRWDVVPACRTPNCEGIYCEADPGTRYLDLAAEFGKHGYVNTICQADFSETLKEIGEFVKCPRVFKLGTHPLDTDLAAILVNGDEIPRYSCTIEGRQESCDMADDQCPAGSECVETWMYCPKDEASPRPECSDVVFTEADIGAMVFANHYDPCKLFDEGSVEIEFYYVPKHY